MSASGAPERRLRNLTVQGWFRLVFTVLGLLVVVAVLAVVALTAQTRDISDELASSILPAQAQAYRLQGALVDQETGVRGYGITGDPRFLQPYTQRAIHRAGGRCGAAYRDRPQAAPGGRPGPGRAGRGRLADQLRPSADQPGAERAAQRQGPHAPGPEQELLRSSPGAVRGAEHPPRRGLARRPGFAGPGPQRPGCGLRGHPARVRARRGRPGRPAGPGRDPAPAPAPRRLGAGG